MFAKLKNVPGAMAGFISHNGIGKPNGLVRALTTPARLMAQAATFSPVGMVARAAGVKMPNFFRR